MAKQQSEGLSNSTPTSTNSFMKGMVKDYNASFQPSENWSHAINAANNSSDGDLLVLGNEPANLQCASIPYTIIGAIHRYADQWVVYTTDDVNSEIGLFDDSKCEYIKLVNDPCLNFNKKYLITGAAKENFDCTWQVYWDDGNNPSRTLNINNIPYVQIQTSSPEDPCVIYTDTTILDCEKLRLAPLLDTPCITLSKAQDGGQLRNGMYQAFVAYVVNDQRVTDYIGVSNLQSLFDHQGVAGSLNVKVTNLDKEFLYYELVILSNNQQNTQAKRIGIYSTEQEVISLDYIDQSLPVIPLKLLPLRSPAYEKSDTMYVVNDYLIRQGPSEQFDFNYQLLANKIKASWVVAEYPSNYYYKGGNKTGLMRDEQYAFFIRFIYSTGERSSSYHIPGRAPKVAGINQFGNIVDEVAVSTDSNALSPSEKNFQVFNTASITSSGLSDPTEDNGIIIAKGEMAYWESSEKYPATRPDMWGDLCGKNIRHHKMPSEETANQLRIATNNGETIRVLGVEFSNIETPKDNAGNPILNIVGYEILRGSREGHKSILAKGIFKNMRKYDIPNAENLIGGSIQGLYPNYPYNDLRDDVYFHNGSGGVETNGCDSFGQSKSSYPPLSGYSKNVFTFHSPELMYTRPFLNAYETRIYGELHGKSEGQFIKSENHPQNKLLRNGGAIIAAIIGVGYAISRVKGDQRYELTGPSNHVTGFLPDTQAGVVPGAIGTIPGTGYAQTAAASAAAAGGTTALKALSDIIGAALLGDLTDLSSLYAGGAFANQLTLQTRSAANSGASLLPGMSSGFYSERYDVNHPSGALPKTLQIAVGMIIAKTNIATGAQEIIDLFYNLVAEEDFAFKYNSHGFFNDFLKTKDSFTYRSINDESNYIGGSFQQFTQAYKINNLFRPLTVGVATAKELSIPTIIDKSRYLIGGDADSDYGDTFIRNPQVKQQRTISALYGALKFNFENQYGQLDGIKQIQMRGCILPMDPINNPNFKYKTNAIFSGDTYIGRHTEKTIMPIFYDFLNGQPNQFTYDYLQRINIPYPRFWMDTRKFDTTELAGEVITLGLINSSKPLPNDLFYLDRGNSSCGSNLGSVFGGGSDPNPAFAMRYAYMYTHCNGIQDFFVESEINVAHRDWEDDPKKRHYDIYEYTDVATLFHADIIKEGNFFKYDSSLSASRFLTNLSTFGNVQARDYDPYVAEVCYKYYPKRLIYSLQAQLESKKDFWRVFLPNNYKDFTNKVNTIKSINKTGAIIFFPYQSPQMFQGVDQLQTDLGTKLTIGDGGLFNQALQSITNSEQANEYGSCESARSVVNTPYGVYFISQAQGKVFEYSGQLNNIANAGMKWWFNKYLPSILIRQYPELETSVLADNPVIGIGCQSIFDANDDVVYFMKKDYSVKDKFKDLVTFNAVENQFYYKSTKIKISNPLYFDNASWTVSYDPKVKAWISYHDWIPELVYSSVNHFLTTNTQVLTTPQCPDGYTFNPVTNFCEKQEQQIVIPTNNVEEVISNITGGASNCLIDIVISVDTSGSTNFSGGGVAVAERLFVTEFINNPSIQNGLNNNTIQIGFTSWAGSTAQTVSMNPGGNSMSSNITAAQVQTWYLSNWFNGGTSVEAGLTIGQTVLNNKATSELGSRIGNPNFRQYLILVTDTGAAPASTVGCPYQSSNLGGSAASYQYVMAVYAGPTSPIPPNPGVLSFISCNQPAYQFGVAANNTPGIAAVSNAVTALACGTPVVCNCPPGYTKVYEDINGNYTLATGSCDPDNPPICRKIECDCPTSPYTGGSTTQSGTCDDIYLLGNPSYVNANPKTCTYDFTKQVKPILERGSFWRHNYRCDLFANYYGVDYPWEVEFIESTGQNVTTLRNIEYQLESYVYKGDLIHGCGDDRWHDLDFNFDESIIYNTEQVSGLLKLNLNPKEDPYSILQYPIVGVNDIKILYSKEEQKYRFNQFWDITKDRGEFSGVQNNIFITRLNGYIKDLNAVNLNYAKDPLQRKKFRHYYNKLVLRRRISGNRKMMLKLANTKLNTSIR